MKTVCNKLLSLMLVAVLLVSAVPFQVFATEGETTAPIETTAVTEAVVETTAATEAPVETVAATEAPVVPAAEEVQDVVNQPAENAISDDATINYIISGVATGSEAFGANDHVLKSVATKIGAKVSGVPGSGEVMTRYAQIFGSSTGKQFSHWSLSDGGTAVDLNNLYVTDANSPNNVLNVYAVVIDAAQYYVEFQKYDVAQGGWVGVKNFNVVPNSTLNTSNGFPTDNEIAAYYAIPGFSIVGWEISDSDTAFVAGSTRVSFDGFVIRPRYQGTLTLMANNPGDYTGNSTKTMTVEIGEPIGALPNPGARDGYAFADWAYINGNGEYVAIANDSTLSNISAHPNYFPTMGTTIYARWTESVVVYLYIHTQGNTQTATKIIPYYNAPAKGAFNLKYIDLYTLWPSFKNFDDNGDTSFGWYSKTQWKNYCAGLAANEMETTVYDVGDNRDYQELHIMLYDNTNGDSSSSSSNNNYNNNSSTADKSNPTTGDMIMMAVTVMAVSAAALALIFFLKKRKASK